MILRYGWYCLLVAVTGEMLVPFVLAPFYRGYSHSTMAISTLGNGNSPVRLPFNLWMLAAGLLLLLSTPAIYDFYAPVSRGLAVATVVALGAFALGACILTCFFSVNETKDVVTTASKIHGAGSAIGFMLLLLVPLLIAILSGKAGERTTGAIALACFVLALLCFVLFVMADKPQLQNTWIAKEGLWQRLTLLFMYLPLAVVVLARISGA